MIFNIDFEEFNRHCDGSVASKVDYASLLRSVNVAVRGYDRQYLYNLTVAAKTDLTHPFIYERWTDMFDPWPAPLMRHFARNRYKLFGWIPAVLSPVLAHRAMSLLPLERCRKLPDADSPTKHIWFVHLANGQLDAGIAFREGPLLRLSGLAARDGRFEDHLLSRVDVVGYAASRSLFHLKSVREPEHIFTKRIIES
jgi:hypothetical protein